MSENAIYLDLSKFTSRETALELIKHGLPREYTEIATEYFKSRELIYTDSLIFFAAISRARGLHEGIVNAIENDNPHSAIILLRAYVELVAIIFYCIRNPHYISRISGIGKEKQKQPMQFSQLFERIADELPGLKAIYSELSEYAHFRELAIYNTLRMNDLGQNSFSWSEAPRWKSEREFYVACAQLIEIAQVAWIGLRRLESQVIRKLDKQIQADTES